MSLESSIVLANLNKFQLRKSLFCTFFIFFTFADLYAYNYGDLWGEGKIKILNDPYFSLQYPAGWMEFNYKSPGVDYVLNASNVGLPRKYNGINVVSAVYVWRYAAKNENEAVKHVLEQPNRAGNALISYVENFKTKNVKGKLIVSYFGQYFGQRNGVRYDFVTYSKKRDQYYGFTLLVQYKKGTGDFAREYDVQEFAEEIFRHIEIKE